MFRPKLFSTIKEYSLRQFSADVIAGSVVGVVALPLAIAFAIASGVSPEKGLYTAVVAGFIISALGGSRVQIGGPTGAFVVIVAGIVAQYGIDGLAVATMMAGVLMIVMGIAGLGAAIKFIPHPLVVGFTSGIAVIIFSSQVKDLLGLQVKTLPAEFIAKWGAVFENIRSIEPWTLGIGLGSILVILVWQRFVQRIPGSLVALLLATAAAAIFQLPVETIGTRFGDIPSTLPTPSMPSFDLQRLRELSQPAITIALLGGIEALLSAVVADGMIGGKHRSNMELVANGVANIASPILGGIPATGAIARTATNVKNGGRTPVAGIVHALVLLIIMLAFGRWARLIPMACLAAILVVVAYNMSEWRTFVAIFRAPRGDIAVLLATFFLTVLVDLTVAIEVGIVLSVFLFMRRMAQVTNIGVITREFQDQPDPPDDPLSIEKRDVPEGVEVYEINGPFFFGAAHKFREAMTAAGTHPKIKIIRMRNVPTIDSSGLREIEEELRASRQHGTELILSGVHTQALFTMERAGLLEKVGQDRIFSNIDEALNCARRILGIPELERPGPFVPTVARENQTPEKVRPPDIGLS